MRVYPTNKTGKCLKGFCPTFCDVSEVESVVMQMAADLLKYGVKFHDICVEP